MSGFIPVVVLKAFFGPKHLDLPAPIINNSQALLTIV